MNRVSSDSRERREHQREVRRQQVRLIRQQESDDCRSQSHGLAERVNDQLSSIMPLDLREALCMEYHVCTSYDVTYSDSYFTFS